MAALTAKRKKRGGGLKHTNHVRLRTEERRAQALALRKVGVGYAEISKALGISVQAAHYLVTGAIARMRAETDETAEEVRAIELQRLDDMTRAIMPTILNQSTSLSDKNLAIDRVLRIQDRRAKFLGLDAPTKVDLIETGRARLEAFVEGIVIDVPAVDAPDDPILSLPERSESID